MKDLTEGSIPSNLLHLAGFLAASMLLQTLYLLVDLFWVGRLGPEAIAAVGVAGNLTFLVLAVTQALGVGTMTLISHAAGRKDQARATLVFNQSFVLSIVCGVAFGLSAFAVRGTYSRGLAADAATIRLAEEYLFWFVPGLALQFGMIAMGSALRGLGIVKPTTVIQTATVLLNMLLTPILIFGWIGPAFGVAGAAIATMISIGIGVLLLVGYFLRVEGYIQFDRRQWQPDWGVWKGMVAIGAPAGGEFVLLSVYLMLVYWIIQAFGAEAQAGFGIGSRMMQALFLPVVAIAFAAAPLAGQNFGARQGQRVRQTFQSASMMTSMFMVGLTLLCQVAPDVFIRLFSSDPAVVAIGAEYLRIISWNFVPVGISFTSAAIFQGIGNTVPPLVSSGARLLLFAVPGFWMSRLPGFELRQLWYLAIASVVFQAACNVWLLQREFRRKLVWENAEAREVPAAAGT